jgi:hypothetical protein
MKRLTPLLGIVALLASAIFFGVWLFRQHSPGRLAWDKPTVKKTVQTFAYKVYGNSQLDHGRYFLSKISLRNDGGSPVTDFSISYQVPGYIEWTTPEALPQIPPGHTVIKCFYPQFPKKVTEIKNKTPSTLEIKIRWNDGRNPTHEEVLREEFAFRGVNEVEYTDLPANEIVFNSDLHVNDDLLAAMVTPNDPVVTEFAAAITQVLGGAVAGAGGTKEAIEVMRGMYYYMVVTGMRYAGGLGLPERIGDTITTVQTIRLPRDVVISNNGLCVELTLLWASVLEHLGIDSYLMLVPHHAYIVVHSGNDLIPFECTAITPKAVTDKDRKIVSFEEANAIAMKEYQDAKASGEYTEVRFRPLQAAGIQPPELPDINIDQVKRIVSDRTRLALQIMRFYSK